MPGTVEAGVGSSNNHKIVGVVLAELDCAMLDCAMLNRLEALRSYMMALGDDVHEMMLPLHIVYERVKNFACVEFQPTTGKIFIFVKVDPSTVTLDPASAVMLPASDTLERETWRSCCRSRAIWSGPCRYSN